MPHRSISPVVKISHLPFYGGAKGQTLQITQTADGKVMTQIIEKELTPQEPSPSDFEHPPLPSKFGDYDKHLKNIHQTALKIIKLQEQAKKQGELNENQQAAYEANMDALNASAKNLAQIDDETDDDEDILESRETGLSSWLQRRKPNKTKDKVKDEEAEKKKKEEEKKKKEQEEEKKRKEEEKKKLEAHEYEEGDDGNEGVAINLPSEDASVAEAKPVGLAVAGVGGVAASKPIATAVVGPGGLAIARPVGTAISGVSPEEALVPIYSEGYLKPSSNKVSKKEAQRRDYINKLIEKYHRV